MIDPPDEVFAARGSGRTTRMLKAALAKALTGCTVIVIAGHEQECHSMMRMLQGLPEMHALPDVHFSKPAMDVQLPLGRGQIRIRSAQNRDWVWPVQMLRNYPPDVPTYIDHYAWEVHLQEEERRKERDLNRIKREEKERG